MDGAGESFDKQSDGGAAVDLEANGDSSSLHQPLLRRGFSGAQPNATSQMAIIGAKSSHIESLDYEIIESDVFVQDWRSRKPVEILQYITVKWAMAFLVGVFTGLVGFFINLSVENIAGFKLLQTSTYISDNRYLLAFCLFAGSNALLVLFSSALCSLVAPAAAGSGIPEVKAYLNGIDAPNILGPRTLVVKILGTLATVAGGLDVGKEGPMVHVGACFASLLGQGGSRQYGLTWRWLRFFKNDRDRRDLVTCGAAAGVAAAFRAPVGGVLFALEEASSWWRSSLLWRAFFTTATCAVTLRLVINYCQSGKCGMFGTGSLIMFDMEMDQAYLGALELIPVIILGVLGGCFGTFFNYVNGRIVRLYSGWHTRYGNSVRIVHAVVVAMVTSVILFGLPWVATCMPCPSDLDSDSEECPSTEGKYKQFTCPAGYYNDLASLFLNTNDNVIRILFSTNTPGIFRYSSLGIFLPATFFLALVTYGTAIPSGLFIPEIIAGAAYGRLIGKIMRSFSRLEYQDEGLYAFLGAASLLGGSMRMTVSLCVILLELTNNLLMLPLTMFVLLIAKTIGDFFTRGIYDQMLHIKQVPLLEEKPEAYMKDLTVSDVCSCSPVTLSTVERVGSILEVLKCNEHNGFPVLEHKEPESPVLFGLILRSTLLVLLKRREFLSTEMPDSGKRAPQFETGDFSKPGSGKGIKIEDIQLTVEEQNMYLDLHPYTNTSPYTVVDNMSLAKAFSLFRQLGLRHLCVVPKTSGQSAITGILTRHDFMPEHVLGLYPHLEQKSARLRFQPSLLNLT